MMMLKSIKAQPSEASGNVREEYSGMPPDLSVLKYAISSLNYA